MLPLDIVVHYDAFKVNFMSEMYQWFLLTFIPGYIGELGTALWSSFTLTKAHLEEKAADTCKQNKTVRNFIYFLYGNIKK